MSVYVIPAGDDPEQYQAAAQEAGCGSIQVGYPDGVSSPGVWTPPDAPTTTAAAVADIDVTGIADPATRTAIEAIIAAITPAAP